MSIYIYKTTNIYFLRLTINTGLTTIKSIYLIRYHLVCAPFSRRTLLQNDLNRGYWKKETIFIELTCTDRKRGGRKEKEGHMWFKWKPETFYWKYYVPGVVRWKVYWCCFLPFWTTWKLLWSVKSQGKIISKLQTFK